MKIRLDRDSITDSVTRRNGRGAEDAVLTDVEYNTPEDSASGCEEVILHFGNGGEILIYYNDEDDTIIIEGD